MDCLGNWKFLSVCWVTFLFAGPDVELVLSNQWHWMQKKAWNGDRWTLCLKIPSIFRKNTEIDFKSSVCIEFLLAGHQLTAVRFFHATTSIKKIASWVTFCTLHSNLKQGTKNYWMWKLKEWAIEHRIGREEWKRMALIRTFSTWMEISAPLNIVLVPTSRW